MLYAQKDSLVGQCRDARTYWATYRYVPYPQVSYVRADPPPPASSRENRASAFKPDKSVTKDGITRAIYRASRSSSAVWMLPSSSCTSMLQAEIKHAPRKSSRGNGLARLCRFLLSGDSELQCRFPSVNEPVRDELAHAHAKQSCANTTRTQSSGGWCLVRLSEAVRPVHCCANLMPVDESQGVERSYYLPAHHYHPMLV